MLEYLAMFWTQFFSWLPPQLNLVFMAFLTAIAIILVFKLVAFIMDVLPIV